MKHEQNNKKKRKDVKKTRMKRRTMMMKREREVKRDKGRERERGERKEAAWGAGRGSDVYPGRPLLLLLHLVVFPGAPFTLSSCREWSAPWAIYSSAAPHARYMCVLLLLGCNQWRRTSNLSLQETDVSTQSAIIENIKAYPITLLLKTLFTGRDFSKIISSFQLPNLLSSTATVSWILNSLNLW